MTTWKPFHFESNLFFDTIAGPDDWERLKKAYPKKTDDELLDAKEATYNWTLSDEHREQNPNYGFAYEHDGVKRLKDFFEINDMRQFLPGQDAKDAARYRWLRKQRFSEGTLSVTKPGNIVPFSWCPSRERMDEAIDKAMAKANPSPEAKI